MLTNLVIFVDSPLIWIINPQFIFQKWRPFLQYTLSCYKHIQQMGRKKNYKAKNTQNVLNSSSVNPSNLSNQNISRTYTDFQQIDFEDDKPKNFIQQFTFTLRELIKLGLIKYFPPKDKTIIVDLKNQTISGEKQKVLNYYQNLKNQNSKKGMKISFFDTQTPPDEIQLEMDQIWQCKIYTSNTFQKVAQSIKKTYKMDSQIQKIKEDIYKGKNPKFLRLLLCNTQHDGRAVQRLKQIYMESKKQQEKIKQTKKQSSSQENSSESSSSENNYYEDIHKNSKETNVIRNHVGLSKVLSQKQLSKKDISDIQNMMDVSQSMIYQKKQSNKIIQNKKSDQNNAKFQKKRYEPKQKIQEREIDSSQNQGRRRGNRIMTQRKIYKQEYNPRHQERKHERNNRYSSDDQINQKQDQPKETNVQIKRQQVNCRVLYSQILPQSKFDPKHFKEWVKRNKSLQQGQVNIATRYNQNGDEKLYEVIVSTYRNTSQKQAAVNMYMNFQKIYVIKNVEKDQIIQHLKEKFVKKQVWIQVKYEEIYTYQKFPDPKKLRALRKNSDKVNKKNSNKFKCFIITGLIPQVDQMHNQIDFQIQNLPKNDEPKQFIIEFPKLRNFMRDQEVFNLIKNTIMDLKGRLINICKITEIKKIYNDIVVIVQIKHDKLNQLIGIQNTLKSAESMIHISTFDNKTVQQSKYVFESLKSSFILRQDQNKNIILIQNSNKFGDSLKVIHEEIAKNKKHVQKVMKIDSVAKLSSVQVFINKRKAEKQDEYQSLKFYSKSQGDKHEIVFIGYDAIIKLIQFQIQNFLIELQSKTYEYSQKVLNQEADLIQNSKQLKKVLITKYQMSISIKKNLTIPAIISVDVNSDDKMLYPVKKIIIQNNFNILALPSNSVIFFRQKSQMDKYKITALLTLKGKCKLNGFVIQNFHQDTVKNCLFYYKPNASPSQILKISSQKYDDVNAFVQMPKNVKQKRQFMDKIQKQIHINKLYLKKNVKLTLIQNQKLDYKTILNIQQNEKKNLGQKMKKWYTVDSGKKLFYSKVGNDKINLAYNQKKTMVELTNQDLQINIATHIVDIDKKVMTHLQSGKEFPITINGMKVTFALNGVQKQLPRSQVDRLPKASGFMGLFKKQSQSVQISLGFYQINFNSKQQINLFSGYSRKVNFDQQIIKQSSQAIVQAEYGVKVNHYVLTYPFQQNKNLKKAIQQIDDYLSEKRVKQVVDLTKNISLQTIKTLQIHADQYQIRLQYSLDKKSVSLYSYDKKNIQKFMNMIKLAANKDKSTIQYPPTWEQQQSPIQNFIVPPNSKEFNDVQKQFTIRPIVQLIRIQNQTIYKKFYDQKMFLTELNEGLSPKQMNLFHGTRSTDPSLIYGDKEEAFNINYTSEHNLLGKGIYFAVLPSYSDKYRFEQIDKSKGAFSMFYCKVLVGQSQKHVGNYDGNIKDTSFKNVDKKIRYESLTAFRQGSDIYVVYKNRRAYPMYLIKYN